MAHQDSDFSNLEVSRANIKNVLELKENQFIMNSSKGKDVVVFLGNTGSGISTLINYLLQKELTVDDNDNIILKNSNDQSAMSIGIGTVSQTIFPQFIQCNQLLFYDLPGFKCTRGTVSNLVNAAFIKNIIENATTVKIVFVAAIDEVIQFRGTLRKQLLKSIKTLIPNQSIYDISGFVVTKTAAHQSIDEIVDKLNHFWDDDSLTKWRSEGRFAIMKSVFNKTISQDERKDILNMINKIKKSHIDYVNISAILSSNDSNTIKKIYIEEMQETFDSLLKNIINTTEIKHYPLVELDKKLYELKKLINDLRFDSSILIRILKTILIKEYEKAFEEFKIQNKSDVKKLTLLISLEMIDRKQISAAEELKKESLRRKFAEIEFEKKISSLTAEMNNQKEDLKTRKRKF